MKPRNIAIALAFCVPLVSTYAQPIPQAREQRLEGTANQLRLTPMQERRAAPILRTEALKVQGIKNDQSLSRSQKLRRLRAVQNRSNRQLRVILTRSQFQQLQAQRQQQIAQFMQAAKSSSHRGAAARSSTPPGVQQR